MSSNSDLVAAKTPIDSALPVQHQHDGSSDGKENWTVITAADAYTENKPYVTKSGEHVRAYGSYVDAKFGSVVIADQGSKVIAEEGSTATVKNGAIVQAFPGSIAIVQKGGDVAYDSKEGSHFTIEDGASAGLWRDGKYTAEVKAGGHVYISKGAEAHVEAGGSARVTEGGKARADLGAKVVVDKGGSVEAPAGTDVEMQTTRFADDIRTIREGAIATVREDGDLKIDYVAQAGSKVDIGPRLQLRALSGSEITAQENSTVFAESGSIVHGAPGATIITKPGAKVVDAEGAIVAGADQTVDFDRLMDDMRVWQPRIGTHSHFVGDGQEAKSNDDIIPEHGRDITLSGDRDWYIPDKAEVNAAAGSTVYSYKGGWVDALPGSHVTVGSEGRMKVEAGAHATAEIGGWANAMPGSYVDGKNGSHVLADKGSNILRHVETDIVDDKGANITWKPTLTQRAEFEAIKLAWLAAPAAVFLSTGFARLRDSARYKSPSNMDYKDHFPDW